MDGEKTQEVTLTHSIPVLILYGTVIVLEDQIVRFYDDIYDQDAELDRVLDRVIHTGASRHCADWSCLRILLRI